MLEKERELVYLWKLVPHFFDFFPFLADDGPMEFLFHDQIFGSLVFLRREENRNVKKAQPNNKSRGSGVKVKGNQFCRM